MKHCFSLVLLLCVLVWLPLQAKEPASTTSSAVVPQKYMQQLRWRCIGPYRAGRSLAVSGVIGERQTYYAGATGGGVWKSEDAGETWIALGDSSFGSSSVGAIAVAPSNPNIIYVGMGETDIRGNISPGDGMYKSEDAGKSWQHIGLKEARMIGDIVVHPENPDILYVASMGYVFAPNRERGVFKSTDGGKSWKHVLFKSEKAGSQDIVMDPHNPKILYASIWEAHRSPWSMSSGGEDSGLWKSTDGGDTWFEITRSPGLPRGIIGKICLSMSAAKRDRIYAMVENSNGGLFRSEDGGKSWTRVNEESKIRQRPWYFSHVIADPQNADVVYVLNVQAHRSTDGGKSFNTIPSRHGDYHDMWIDPQDSRRMIIADDGGPCVSEDYARHWTEQDIPTAQFYHVTVDNAFPYRVYGAQQDNSTICIASRTTSYSIGKRDWFPVAGGESGYVTPHPTNNDITFGGNYGGFLGKYNARTDQSQDVSVYPDNPVGIGAEFHAYRFQWTYPIFFSPHDNSILYTAGNHVFRSKDEGMSWEEISPDLTTNNKERQKASGGPITKDNTGVETYCTIFALAESYVEKDVLYAGSDDGLVHLTRDGGQHWQKITPPSLPADALISIIEPSRHTKGTVYLAANRYKLNDFKPYFFKSTDYGTSWQTITKGIPAEEYARVIREDPAVQGLLYCGTERGIYVSFNDGNDWQSLRLNLPQTPVHDMVIQQREKDLVIATHGRSFWILDDLTPLHELRRTVMAKGNEKNSDKKSNAATDNNVFNDKVFFYAPRHSYRFDGGSYYSPGMDEGENATNGAVFYYNLADTSIKELTLTLYSPSGDSIAAYSSKKTLKGEAVKESKDFYTDSTKGSNAALTMKQGMNRFVWNMYYPDATEVQGAVIWGGSMRGPKAIPGTYKALLKWEGGQREQQFVIRKDPRLESTDADFAEQFSLHKRINAKLSEVNSAINTMRELRKQINALSERMADEDSNAVKPLKQRMKETLDSLQSIEDELIQNKSKSGQDVLNYPMKLNNKLAAIAATVASADTRPTKQSYKVYDDIAAKADVQLARWKAMKESIAELNKLANEKKIPAVRMEKKEN